MKMNKKLYDATSARIRSHALEALAKLEMSLLGATGDTSTVHVDSIVALAEDLARLEGALLTLQQYFPITPPIVATPPTPQAPPGPAPQTPAPLKVTPEMSATYKKSIAVEKKRKKAQDARIKREASEKGKKENKDG